MLSRAARLILIKSTLAALPNYAMQTIKLPRHTIQQLDRLYRNFFWGSSDQQRRLHTVAWNTICKPKESGGLGIPRLKDMNYALLAKQVWKLALQRDEDLVHTLLSSKCGGWGTLIRAEKHPSCSSTWRSLAKVAS